MGVQHGCGFATEGHPPGQHLVTYHAQGIDVRSTVNFPSFHLFWRHVGWRAHNDSSPGQRGTRSGLGDAKVSERDAIARAHDDVGRFDVSVYKPFSVGIVQSRSNLAGDVHCPLQWQGAFPSEEFVEWQSLQVLHHDIVDALLLLNVKDGDNVGMLEEARCGFGLLLESVDESRIQAELRCQHLEGHVAAQGRLPGLVDDGHAAPADFLQDVILPQGFADQVAHVLITPYARPRQSLPTGLSPGPSSRRFLSSCPLRLFALNASIEVLAAPLWSASR